MQERAWPDAAEAAALGLTNDRGEPDDRLVSPHLKKVTHAVRRFTGDPEAACYTLGRLGGFYLEPGTLDGLRAASERLFYREGPSRRGNPGGTEEVKS